MISMQHSRRGGTRGHIYRRVLAAGVIGLAAAGVVAWPAGGSPAVVAPLEREFKAELFRRAPQPLLEGYQAGDTVVAGGAVDDGQAICYYGHMGVLTLPLEAAGVPRDSLVRGRFQVVEQHGQKRLALRRELQVMSTGPLKEQSARSYQALIPRIEAALSTARLPVRLEAIPAAKFQVVPPPEGWQVLYATARQVNLRDTVYIALRFQRAGAGEYRLTRCWTEALPRSERG